ncbi:hypothetical protein, partial [Klebsiella sp. 20_N_Kleb]|uniref:hypothetical protein n=1 Tax=Klebsiella sp. 20_N_Kleb TaxID=3391445 RepID=UPI003D170CB8
CVEQDDKGWDARKRAYCLKIQPATGSFARNLIYSTKPVAILLPWNHTGNQILNYYNPVNRMYWYVSNGAFSAIPETQRYFKYT